MSPPCAASWHCSSTCSPPPPPPTHSPPAAEAPMKRSHEALRARDLGLRSLRSEYPQRLQRREPTDAERPAWLKRTRARLEAPTHPRPHRTVRLGPPYLPAGKTGRRPLTAAMHTPLRPPVGT